jgi:hypothetical protein
MERPSPPAFRLVEPSGGPAWLFDAGALAAHLAASRRFENPFTRRALSSVEVLRLSHALGASAPPLLALFRGEGAPLFSDEDGAAEEWFEAALAGCLEDPPAPLSALAALRRLRGMAASKDPGLEAWFLLRAARCGALASARAYARPALLRLERTLASLASNAGAKPRKRKR